MVGLLGGAPWGVFEPCGSRIPVSAPPACLTGDLKLAMRQGHFCYQYVPEQFPMT